jgi:alpha-tubulin suppressor-like RCC1 family protein
VPVAAASQPLSDFAAGDGAAVVLTQAGNVISWGLTGLGVAEADIPVSVRSATITAVAAGQAFALALSSTGRVYQWGSLATGVPAEALAGVSLIAAASETAVAVRNDGSLVFWGDGECVSQQFISGSSDAGSGVVRLPWLEGANITAISVSATSVVALLHNGSALQWGCTWDEPFADRVWLGQLEVPATARHGTAQVAAGFDYAMARTADNKLVMWGNSAVVANTPGVLLGPGALNITAISAGRHHALALLANGTLAAWGVSMNSPAVRAVPDGSVQQGRVLGMSAGTGFSLALTEPTGTPERPPSAGMNDGQGSAGQACVRGPHKL